MTTPAKAFAKKFNLTIDFVKLIDKGYESNWSREDIERLHTNEFVGKSFSLHMKAINGSAVRKYTIIKVWPDQIRPGTCAITVKSEDGKEHPTFNIRKNLITMWGITLDGLMKGKETIKVNHQIAFNK